MVEITTLQLNNEQIEALENISPSINTEIATEAPIEAPKEQIAETTEAVITATPALPTDAISSTLESNPELAIEKSEKATLQEFESVLQVPGDLTSSKGAQEFLQKVQAEKSHST